MSIPNGYHEFTLTLAARRALTELCHTQDYPWSTPEEILSIILTGRRLDEMAVNDRVVPVVSGVSSAMPITLWKSICRWARHDGFASPELKIEKVVADELHYISHGQYGILARRPLPCGFEVVNITPLTAELLTEVIINDPYRGLTREQLLYTLLYHQRHYSPIDEGQIFRLGPVVYQLSPTISRELARWASRERLSVPAKIEQIVRDERHYVIAEGDHRKIYERPRLY